MGIQDSAGYLCCTNQTTISKRKTLVHLASILKILGKGRFHIGENMYNVYYFIKYMHLLFYKLIMYKNRLKIK